MRSRALIPAIALGAALAASATAASRSPFLRSAFASHRHVVVVYTLSPDLAPGRVLVAKGPQTTANGEFVRANVRLSEPLGGTRTSTGYRMRTRHTLRPGRYYVEVSGTVIGLDCTPTKPCPMHWSNIRRISIRR
jgi:hypothetical protein